MKEIFHTLGLITLLAIGAGGQQPTPAAPRSEPLVRVFIECPECDHDYLRDELQFVNLVRDRLLADVHIIVSALETGGGGRSYTMEFLSSTLGRPAADTLTVVVPNGATFVERREHLARALKLGLVPFLRGNAVLSRLDLSYRMPNAKEQGATRGARDRWKQWVFGISGSGNLDADDNYGRLSGDSRLSAARVTDGLKTDFSVRAEYAKSRFRLSDSSTIVSHTRSWSVRGLVVRSIGPRLSAGINMNAGASVFQNVEREVRAMSALEFDFFPYAQATRRRAIVRYSIGPRAARYVDTTVYGKLAETRAVHEVLLSSAVRQPWGEVWVTSRWSEYLHDRTKRRLNVDYGVDWRIRAGLSVFTGASYSFIRDQLNVRGANLSDEDRLLRLRELRSGYSFNFAAGLSYTFGSVFNNVVNPRLNQ